MTKYFGNIAYLNKKNKFGFITPNINSGLEKEYEDGFEGLIKCKDIYFKLSDKHIKELEKFYNVSFYIEEKDGKTYARDVKLQICYCREPYCDGPQICGTRPCGCIDTCRC
jgi:hypothetical protein